jgi:hypothetical protein
MIDLIGIYVHRYAGRSQAQIADSLGMDRKTCARTWRRCGELRDRHPGKLRDHRHTPAGMFERSTRLGTLT